MTTSGKLRTILGAKLSKWLNICRDPIEELEYSYEKQKDLLNKVRTGITDVATSKKRLELRKAELEKDLSKFDSQAKQCIKQGDENLAKIALERKNSTQNQIVSLTEQIKKLSEEQEKLSKAEKVLEMKLDELNSTKETVKAQYIAAKASVKVGESISGIGDEVGSIGTAMENAKDRTEEMTARSSAIEELTEAGVLSNALGQKEDTIDRELRKAQSTGQVNEEFRKMKRQQLLEKNDLDFFKV